MTIIRTKKRIFGSSKLKKMIRSRSHFRTWRMLCVACLKSHKWGLFPHRSDPHNDIIWTKVNLFDIFDEIHNLPSTLQLSKFVCPLRSPPPQTGPAFSASCSEDPPTTQVWSSVFYKSCISLVFLMLQNSLVFFSKYSQHLWSTTSG